MLDFMFRERGQTILLALAYGLIPLLFILERCGISLAGRYLYESLYICVMIAIVAATIYERTVGDLVKNVLCACGVVFLELSAVAYLGLLLEPDRRPRPGQLVEQPRYQFFHQFQQRRQMPPPVPQPIPPR